MVPRLCCHLCCQGGGQNIIHHAPASSTQREFQQLPHHLTDILRLDLFYSSCSFKLLLFPCDPVCPELEWAGGLGLAEAAGWLWHLPSVCIQGGGEHKPWVGRTLGLVSLYSSCLSKPWPFSVSLCRGISVWPSVCPSPL